MRYLLTLILILSPVMVYAAYPTVETTSHGNGSALSLPASIAVGDLVVVMVYSTSAITTPSGWTQITTRTESPVIFTMLSYVATSTNTSYSLPNTLTYNAYRISGFNGAGSPEATTATQSDGNAGDPPSLTPTWGSSDNLWVSGMVRNTVFESDCAAGYADKVYDGDTGEVVSCRKTATAASDDPGTLSSANNGGTKISFTLAVQGAGAAGNSMLMGMTF